jgi:hypothetical protein
MKSTVTLQAPGYGQVTKMVAAGNPLGGVRSYLADEFDFTAPDCPGLHFMGAIADSSLLKAQRSTATCQCCGQCFEC